MGILDLTVLVGEHRRAGAVQDGGPAAAERGRARGLDPDEPHVLVVEEAVEDPDRVRAAADARHHRLREPLLDGEQLLACSRPITDWSSATSSGYGAGPTHEPIK